MRGARGDEPLPGEQSSGESEGKPRSSAANSNACQLLAPLRYQLQETEAMTAGYVYRANQFVSGRAKADTAGMKRQMPLLVSRGIRHCYGGAHGE